MQMTKLDEIFLFILNSTKKGNGSLVSDIKKELNLNKNGINKRIMKLYKMGAISRTKEYPYTRYFSIIEKSDYMSFESKAKERECPKDDQIQNPQMDKFIFSGNKKRISENLHY